MAIENALKTPDAPTTTLGIVEIQDIGMVSEPHPALPAGNTVIVLCEGVERLSIADVQAMFRSGYTFTFRCCASRDERLIELGSVLETSRACVIFGDGLPIPARWDNVVHVAGKRPSPRKPRQKNRKQGVSETNQNPEENQCAGTDDAETEAAQRESAAREASAPAMNVPESPATPPEMQSKAATAPPRASAARQTAKPASLAATEDLAFTEAENERLYQLIGIKAADIGFSWPTDTLMARILTLAAEAANEAELAAAIKNSIRNSKKLLQACKGHETEILRMGREVQ